MYYYSHFRALLGELKLLYLYKVVLIKILQPQKFITSLSFYYSQDHEYNLEERSNNILFYRQYIIGIFIQFQIHYPEKSSK